jgi:ABC-type polysaccharide/polyol phosphate transport system ATPase subunit
MTPPPADPTTAALPTPNTPAIPRPAADSAEIAISVRGVSKMYRIYQRSQDRLKQMLWRGRRSYGREFWALREVSFDVYKGETLGIIGRNGGGKSTLLQIIAGTLAPTRGEVWVGGRTAALLELGSGFDPEFTGRENVFLSGAILGIGRAEMEQRFDEIAAFAEIGAFIDQPVKTYSSGMFVRLAFAVQACVDPDILIVDEALAVGDIFFRQKCYQRLEKLRQKGTAVLLVSHSMMEIEQFCQRALLLHGGQPMFLGAAAEATKLYMLLDQQDRAPAMQRKAHLEAIDRAALPQPNREEFWPPPEALLDMTSARQVSNGWARCSGVAICDSQGQPCRVFQQGQTASFFYEFELERDVDVPIGGLVIHSDRGTLVHGKSTLEYGTDVPTYVASGTRLRFRQDIALEIAMGEYTIEPGLAALDSDVYERRATYSYDQLHGLITRICHLPAVAHFVVTQPHDRRPIQLLHHGVANLPGDCRLVGSVEHAHAEPRVVA